MEGNQMAQGSGLPEDQLNYIKFFHKNFDLYRGIITIADVAVLHSYSSMAFNNDRPYQSTYLFEQTLIQNRIPFDIIFDDQLKNLSKYKVLILADQECLNDENLALIRAYVQNGGGLVATGMPGCSIDRYFGFWIFDFGLFFLKSEIHIPQSEIIFSYCPISFILLTLLKI
jgi:hypothetical protein